MKYVIVRNYILNQLSTFMIDNKVKILNEEIHDGYGFNICIGNIENYVFIFYGIHIYPYPYEMLIGFGKRAFVKDKDLKYVIMKPCYRINDFHKDLCLQIEADFQKDKKTINKICKVIPVIFETVSNQSEQYFFDNCIKQAYSHVSGKQSINYLNYIKRD